MDLIDKLKAICGDANVLTGAATDPYRSEWTGRYVSDPLCVARPATTEEVAQIVTLANHTGTVVVPAAGRTGLNGGTKADGAILLSVERMRNVRGINKAARTATVEAGVVLAALHSAVDEHGLAFPVFFGARGSAMIGGILSTNAGGSNVLRYGNTRALVLGIEAVLPTGEILDLMSELHKDNSGLDLKDLLIGAEGTLGIITAAVVKLVERPTAYATAMVATKTLDDALDLLNTLQRNSGGAVEAFEYMPGDYFERLAEVRPDLRPPFEQTHDVNILVELGATAPRDTTLTDDGSLPLTDMLEDTLMARHDTGQVLDAVVARSDRERLEMWARRESAAEVSVAKHPNLTTDVAVPLDKVGDCLTRAYAALKTLDPGVDHTVVSHLGDGNIHLTIWPSDADESLRDQMNEAIEDIVLDLRGSFSAEHGIGLAKLNSMRRRKNPAAIDTMRRIKQALDPNGILNPGKVIPD